jgi:integrase
MLLLGFHTGLRIESIADLRTQTLQRAIPHPLSENFHIVHVGPGASPPVKTKYDITGQIEIPTRLLRLLTDYVSSSEHTRRREKATPADKNIVFLTIRGNQYARRDLNSSPAINVAMYQLRQIGLDRKIEALGRFKFHQTRATFATELILHAVTYDPENCLNIVSNSLLQRDEQSALAYIKFVKREHKRVSANAANKFTQAFLGRFHED